MEENAFKEIEKHNEESSNVNNFENKKNSKNKPITLNIFKNIISVIIFVFFIIFFIQILLGIKQSKERELGYISIYNKTFFEVISGSMQPKIKVGDLVVVELKTENNEEKQNIKNKEQSENSENIENKENKENNNYNLQYEIGDILSFKSNNSIVTHRIIEKDETKGEYITQGDANNAKDKPIKENDIIGEVIYVIPKIGIYKKVLMHKDVLGVILAIITVLTIYIIVKKVE